MSGANTSPDAQAIRSLRLQLLTAEQQLKDSSTAVKQSLETLEEWDGSALATNSQTKPAEREIALRRAGGGRKPREIGTDPEIEAFIRKRINRLTLERIVSEAAAAFA